VLGSSFGRAASSTSSPRQGKPSRRRLVAVALVLVSLVLLTVYFRESGTGRLHDAQSTGAAVLRPFEVAANRVAQPFRDLSGWISGLTHAKAQNEKLRREVDQLRQQLIQSQTARQENATLQKLLGYRDGRAFPRDYRGHNVAAAVIGRPQSQFEQQIVIAAGSRDGIRLHDPVVTNDGLVGQVTKVARSSAQVTLLNDESSAVSAVDLASNASGVLRHGPGGQTTLVLDRVTKDQVVERGDRVVTSGWRAGELASLYPRGIPIGVVTSVGQTDVDLYKQIQVRPFVDLGSLSAVLVLTGSR
jgi:rod shape-determining protein MreC